MPVTSYSTVAANNTSAPPNGAPEGWAPSAVNDTIRQIMADVAVEAQKNAVKVLGSVAGTNTITGSMTPDLTAYSASMLVVLTPANSNTGAATLNIDSLGALDVQKLSGSALVAGDLVAGVPALLVLDSGADDWILINPQASTGTGSAVFSASPTLTGTVTAATLNATTLQVGGSTVLSASLQRIARARVASDGTLLSGSTGITSVVRNSVGNYTIDLTAAGFTAVPTCVACGTNVLFATLSSGATSTSVTVNTIDPGGSNVDSAFTLICLGV